jgi:hypothetical protein
LAAPVSDSYTSTRIQELKWIRTLNVTLASDDVACVTSSLRSFSKKFRRRHVPTRCRGVFEAISTFR